MVCPQCEEPIGAADARFCGRCGALLAAVDDAAVTDDEVGAETRPSSLRPVAFGALVAVSVLLAVVAFGGTPPGPEEAVEQDAPVGAGAAADAPDVVVPPSLAAPATVNRQFPATARQLWERRDVSVAPSSPEVVAAGAHHVRIGERLVRTTPGPQALWALPASTGVVRRDGHWALVELGAVVLGDLEGGRPSLAAPDRDWSPDGPVLAWGPFPVLRGADGTLAAVTPEGLAWRTAERLEPGTVVGENWLPAEREDGSDVAVELATGLVVDMPAAPLAFVDDTVLIAGDETVALDLFTGDERWRRAPGGAEWVVTGATLVELGAGQATRVDPATGEDRGTVTGFVPIPSGDVVVVQQPGRVVATDFDGEQLWSLALEPQGTHAVIGIDEQRVAVRSQTGDGPRVTVLDAATGEVLAVEAVAPVDADLVLGEGVVEVRGATTEVLVDLETGDDVAGEGPQPPALDLGFLVGGDEVEIEAGDVLLRAVDPDGVAVWTTELGAPIAAGPRRTGTSLVVGLADGRVVVVDPSTGMPRWETDVVTLPTAVGGNGAVLLAGTANGEVLRFDPSGNPVTRIELGGGPVLSLVPGRPAVVLLPNRLVGIDVTPS